MARTQYSEVVTFIESGTLKPADNARVNVYLPGTTTNVTIYTTRTGGVTKANPFTTVADGVAEFWAEWGDYDIKYEDLTVPSRFGPKTFGWSSTSGANAAIPLVAQDAAIGRQHVPVGAVISWWRPNNTVGIPAGWAICDGSTVLSADHDFGTGASIVLPDLRNKFILGANSVLADAAAATAGDAATNAPGIRGTGSSHGKNLQHSHTVNAHSHTVNSHSHTYPLGIGLTSGQGVVINPNQIGFNAANNTKNVWNLSANGIIQSTQAIENWYATSDASSPGTSNSTPGTDSQLGTAFDIKPLYVGLLQLMKIKRS